MTSSSKEPAIHLVIGTAGHIDHGKSSLVQQLTGQNPSRLKEERDRGMTIDIGYAEFAVNDRIKAGIIDVPGHERFIRNMVAGASGVDFVLLVVAADDGVMLQTREHLQIMRLLGIQHGLTVLTKIDAVDAELREIVEDDLRGFLQGTFLETSPIVGVSNVTGEGIDTLRETLRSALIDLPEREETGVFRMPIQRSFSIQGHGTVVTGVPVSGRVSVRDVLEVLPRGIDVRVRGIQVHHRPSDHASAGHRAALNLTDVNYRDVHRGDVVAAKGFFSAASLLEARLEYLPHHETPLRNRMSVRLHVGCADVRGTVVLLDHPHLLPGESGLVQLRLEEEVVVAAGDRFVLRLESPVITLGGGVILGETRWRFKRFRDWLNENIAAKEEHLGDRRRYLEYVVRSQGKKLMSLGEVALAMKERPEDLLPELDALSRDGRVLRVGKERGWIHRDMFKQALKDVSSALLVLHDRDRLQAGFAVASLVKETKLELALVEATLDEWVRRGKMTRLGNRKYRHGDWTGGLSKEDYRLVTLIESLHKERLFASPIRSEIVAAVDKPEKKVKELLEYLFQMGTLVPITPDLALHHEAIEEAERRLVHRIQEKGPMPSKEFKDIIDASRKYVIPLLEYFDKLGVTRRIDNERVLADGWEQRIQGSSGVSEG